MASSVQQTFGKYKLIRRIAFGGMAEVFLGTVHGEAGFSKSVVIKRLHPRLNEDSEFVQMLIDEARITSQLTHSNICQVLDLGSVDDSYYIAMEYIAGEDLRTVLDHYARRGEFIPVEAAIHIMAETLAGLDYAHAKEGADGEGLGVIHRDVSPQNVLISYEGEVKVIDFGIAKARSRMVQTQAGVIKGKFRYMSPEQASGQEMDHRTDVFAAGVVLYELLRGRPHSQNVPDTEVLRRMRQAEFEPIQRSRDEVPDELLKIISGALQRKMKKRWATAADFRRALLGYSQQRGSVFGRSELSQLMKTIFPLERRRERSGQSAKSKRESVRAAVVDPFAPETPSGTAIQGESEVTTGRKDLSEAAFAATRATFTPERTAATTSERMLGAASPASPSALNRVPTAPIQDSVLTSARGSASGESKRPRVISGEIENSQPLAQIATDQQTMARSLSPPGAGRPSEESLRATVARPPQSSSAAIPPLQRDAAYEHHPEDPRRQAHDSMVATHYVPGDVPPVDEGIPQLAPPEEMDWPPEPAPPSTLAPPPEAVRQRGGAFSRGEPKPIEAGRKLPRSRRRIDPQEIREGPRRDAQVQPTSVSHTEQVARGKGGGASRAFFALIAIGGLAVAAFYAGQTYLSQKDGAGPVEATDLAVRPVVSSKPDAAPRKPVKRGHWVRVHVESSPRGAAIRLCGRDTGKVTPATIRQRRKGRCELVLTLKGHESYSAPLALRGKKRLKINATLRPARQEPLADVGVLKVTSIQVGQVFINGQKVGKTPGLRVKLRPGRYEVKVRFFTLGTNSRARMVTIYGGRTSQLHFDPE